MFHDLESWLEQSIVVPPGRFVVGAAQLGQLYGNGRDRSSPSGAEVARILAQAAEVGILDIDTARAYGDSELMLGRVGAGASGWRIVTKIRPLTLAAQVSRADVTAAVRRSISESFKALQVSSVETILLHRAADLQAGGGAAAGVLDAAVGAGVARRWGVSISSPEELLSVCRVPGVRAVQLPFNLLDRRWSVPQVQRALAGRPDIVVTARSVLLQGLLATDEPGRWPVLPGLDAGAMIARLRESATVCDRTPSGLAIGYALAHPWVQAVVLGLRRTDQLVALAASVAAPPLSAAEVDRVNRSIPAGPADLIDPARWPPH